MSPYTKELIHQTITHFKTKYNHDIDEDTAEQYLTACVELFEALRVLLEEQALSEKQNATS